MAFYERRSVGRKSGLVGEIIESDDGAFKRNFAQVLGTDLVEGGVRLGNGIFHGSLDRFRCLLPGGNR